MTADIELRVRAQAAQAEATLGRLESRSGRLGRALKTAVVGGALAASYGVAKLGIASVKAASDSEQSIGATETVFKRYADTVERQSIRAARSLGLSANEYRELSNVTGAMLKSSGLPLRKVTGLTADLNQRAADVAATFGGSTREAVEAFGSLLRGETDPVERYGVSIKQSDVNARLAARGQDELTGAAKKQAEQVARLDLLFKQTADSQGTFSRESNTLAGQTQRLQAQSSNLTATIGKGLTPGLTVLATTVGRKVLPPLQDLAERYAPAVGRELGEVAEAAGPKLERALSAIPGFLRDLKSSGSSGELSSIADSAKELGPPVADLLRELPSLNDALSVSAEVIGFAADNTDLLRKALPFLVAGFAAVKVAQLGSNVAQAASLPIKIAELRVNRQLAVSNRALVASRTADTVATRVNTSAQATNLAASSGAARGVRRLGGVARGAAGLAGIGALTVGMGNADTAGGQLVTTAGAIATGFAVGGPIGAAVGGLGSAFLTLKGRTDRVAESTGAFSAKNLELRDTLDQVTGAASRQTREMVASDLQKKGLLRDTAALGIASRDVVSAVLGEQGARKRLTATIQANRNAGGALATLQQNRASDAAVNLASYLGVATKRFEGQRRAVRGAAEAVSTWSEVLRGVPKRAHADVKALGVKPAIADVRRLGRQYDLTPKQVRTLIRVLDAEPAKRKAGEVKKSLEGVSKTRPNLTPFQRAIVAQIASARAKAGLGTDALVRRVETGTRSARPDLGPFNTFLGRAFAAAQARASAGGVRVGSALGAGVNEGASRWFTTIASTAASIVRNAVQAANNAGEIRSPSRKMQKVGQNLGRGLRKGLRDTRRINQAEASRLVQAVLKGASEGQGGALAAQKKWLKAQKATRREQQAAVAMSGYQRTQLVKVARAQASVTERLKEAREASAQYGQSVRETIRESGNITGFLDQETGTTTSRDLIDQLKDRAVAADRYADLIDQLRGRLNATSLRQLIDAGPEAGLATAEAIAAGGSAAVSQLNSLSSQLERSGARLSGFAQESLYGAGKNATSGLIAGLMAQEKALDREATRIGNRLVAAVRKALRINSPSRVFEGIGQRSVEGLRIGLDETYVRRAGQATARALVDGYGRPQLEAAAVARVGGGGPAQTVHLKLSADQVSQLQRGRQIAVDLDAYRGSGGTKGRVS